MNIAIAEDTLRPVNEAIRSVIPGDLNPSTIWRWISKGIAGVNGERIRLRVWYRGRSPYTSISEVKEWLDKVTHARLARLVRTQHRAADVSEEELAAVGLVKPPPP